MPIQFIFYLFIGGTAALVNLAAFLVLSSTGLSVVVSAPTAFILAAAINYLRCFLLLFRHKARWDTLKEIVFYGVLVLVVAGVDLK